MTQTKDSMIRLSHVTKLYKTVIGVNDINLELEPGAYGLLGPNGSGKTTFINLLIGQLQPTIGSVSVFGKNPWGNDSLLRRVGLCPAADILYPSVTAFDWVKFLVELYGFAAKDAKRRAEWALEQVRMSDAMHRPIGTYSLGMRQRSKLAQAIAHEPDLLILDEPFNGLDPVGRFEMSELLKNLVAEGKSLIFASHICHEVESITPAFLLISGGRLLASGSMTEVRHLLTDIPNELYVRSSDRQKLSQLLLAENQIDTVRFDKHSDGIFISTNSPIDLMQSMANILSDNDLQVFEVRSEEGTLQQLFATLMKIHRGEV